MAGLSFPDVGIFLSGVDPNDPNTVDLWSSNLAPARAWRINQADRGRQFELDQNIEGNASVDFRNVDEWLNPANSTSPLLQFVKPMRRTRMMYSYPPAGTGNLVNTTAGMDPTFDSYTTGTLPSWLTPVGGTAPTVSSGGSHSGANKVGYSIAATSQPQGLSTSPLPFFPGQQYTASIWLSQGAANTQQIAVGGLTALDRFQRTGALVGSSAESGQTWSFSGGVSGDYTTTAGANPPGVGVASISSNTVAFRYATLPLGAQDFDQRVLVTIPAVATGNALLTGMHGRFVDINNQYILGLSLNTSGVADVKVWKNVAATITELGANNGAFSYAAGTQVWIRAQGIGTTLQCKVWAAGTVEPAAWNVTVTNEATFTAGGPVGFIDARTSGNTNASPVFTHARYAVTSYSTPGATTTTSGAYVRLQVTFTATQPTHTIALTTIGTSVSSAVSVDDIQVEPGGTANTFTNTGPLIRGMWGGQLADDQVTWVPGTQGFEGMVQAPFVGPLAALAQTPIHTDYVTAVLRKVPDYYWPLWDPTGATTFAEISGRGGPPLTRLDGYFGAGPTFNAGTSTNIPGDPSGAGLATDQPTAGALNLPVSIASSDLLALRRPVAIGQASGTYGYTVSAWISHTSVPSSSANRLFMLVTNPASSSTFQAVWNVDGIDPTKLDFGSASVQVIATNVWADGKPHHFVHTMNQAGGNQTHQLWVDGKLIGTATAAVFAAPQGVVAQIGGAINPAASTTSPGLNGGVYSHFAVWNRVLSNAEIQDLWSAGSGNQGELSGTRAARYLANYYTGPSTVDTASMSQMGPPTAPESTPLLQALQRINDTEMGNLFETRDGAVQFDGREVRWQRLSPTVVFGDGPGEIPYEEAPVFGYGLTQVNNQALVTRSGGIRAVGRADTTGSSNSFYQRGYTLTVDCQSDTEAQQHADWVVLTRSQPKQRVSTIRINLAANPSAFPSIMTLEIGTRVTNNRRPKAANAGAGITMSGDFFVEKITHQQIDPAAATWFVDLQLSPVPTPQPWICGDATYGKCGVTTIPGF